MKLSEVVFWTFFYLAFVAVVPAWAAIPAAERNALVSLYNETGGASWTNSEGWLGAAGSECQWFGVTCDSGETTVLRLELFDNGLAGSIPPSLADLTNLELLYLCCQQLSGPIPSELGSLTSLKSFHAQSNQLSGSLPAELGNLEQLEDLYLWSNQFTGSIPPELGNLENLETWYMCCNQLSGSIPVELAGLTSIEELYLYSNDLTGVLPAELASLATMTDLHLRYNQLSGTIPEDFGNLTALRALRLGSNDLGGQIPSSLGALANLEILEIEENNLSGELPAELASLNQLQVFRAQRNQLTGELPSEFGNLINLNTLRLDRNHFTGALPREFGNLMALQQLRINSNMLTGEIPDSLLNLAQLAEEGLDLQYNGLYSTDSELSDHLNTFHQNGNFEDTQTIAPSDIGVSEATEGRVSVNWTPIDYTFGEGGYRISHSPSLVGPWTVFGETPSKSDDSMVVTNLDPGLNYYFRVQTITEAHSNNDNRVVSDASELVSAGISYWLEIAAHLQGQFESQWRTDVVAKNQGDTETTVFFTLHTSDGEYHLENTIEPSAQAVFEDVVGLMDYEGKGALEIRSSQPLLANARIYNQGEEGTIGQFVDAFTTAEGLMTGDAAWLLQLRQSEGVFRTNISLTNTGTETAVVRVSLYQTDATELVSYQKSIEPGQLYQETEPFVNRAGQANLGWGFAKISVIAGHGVLASASVIDSVTNDATTIAMKR